MATVISGSTNMSTPADRKLRFGGILEYPLVSKIQRAILDGGRVGGLKKGLQSLEYQSILDIGCGLGECSTVNKGRYIGVDNSFPRIAYAARRYPQHTFFVADALHVPVADQSVDLAMLIDTSHHLTDEQFIAVLNELARISRRYLVVSDPVLFPGQGAISRFFYQLDRGACFRTQEQSLAVFSAFPRVRFLRTFSCRTFPGLYIHQAFVLEVIRR